MLSALLVLVGRFCCMCFLRCLCGLYTPILLAVLSVLLLCCFVARSLPEAGVPWSFALCVRIVQLASGWKGKRAAATMGNTCVVSGGVRGVCGEGKKSKAETSTENL